MLPVAPTVDDDVRLRRWQAVTGAALLLGYMGYYICRSNLSVATPALISGGVSTLAAGFASDRVGQGNRIAAAAPCLLLCVASLLALASTSRSLNGSMWAIIGVAFWLLGPYSLLAGAVALDFGGRRGSATAAGLIDTAGYLAAGLTLRHYRGFEACPTLPDLARSRPIRHPRHGLAERPWRTRHRRLA
jgi:sugar phosphate permease